MVAGNWTRERGRLVVLEGSIEDNQGREWAVACSSRVVGVDGFLWWHAPEETCGGKTQGRVGRGQHRTAVSGHDWGNPGEEKAGWCKEEKSGIYVRVGESKGRGTIWREEEKTGGELDLEGVRVCGMWQSGSSNDDKLWEARHCIIGSKARSEGVTGRRVESW